MIDAHCPCHVCVREHAPGVSQTLSRHHSCSSFESSWWSYTIGQRRTVIVVASGRPQLVGKMGGRNHRHTKRAHNKYAHKHIQI